MILQNADIRFSTETDENNETHLDKLNVNGFEIDVYDIDDMLGRHDFTIHKACDNIEEVEDRVNELEIELKNTKFKLCALIATSFIFSILLFFIK